jgi:hypothetical protein
MIGCGPDLSINRDCFILFVVIVFLINIVLIVLLIVVLICCHGFRCDPAVAKYQGWGVGKTLEDAHK